MRTIWDGQKLDPPQYQAMLGVLVIKGIPYIVKQTGSSNNCPLYDMEGNMIEAFALHLGIQVMQKIYAKQAPLSF